MEAHTKLRVWQQARRTTLACLGLARHRWKPFAGPLFHQLLKASLSVQLNIAEGYALRGPARKRQFWTVACGSAVETVECLERLRDSGVVEEGECASLIQEARHTAAGLLALLRKV